MAEEIPRDGAKIAFRKVVQEEVVALILVRRGGITRYSKRAGFSIATKHSDEM